MYLLSFAAATLLALVAPSAIAAPPPSPKLLKGVESSTSSIERLERLWERQYENHLQLDRTDALSADRIRETLARFAREDRRAALIYFSPEADGLEIVVVSPDGDPLSVWVPIPETQLNQEIARFAGALQHPALLPPDKHRIIGPSASNSINGCSPPSRRSCARAISIPYCSARGRACDRCRLRPSTMANAS